VALKKNRVFSNLFEEDSKPGCMVSCRTAQGQIKGVQKTSETSAKQSSLGLCSALGNKLSKKT
jgi:hypothetical protein